MESYFTGIMAIVAIPIETKVRELYGKLWLGLNLIESGHTVLLGPAFELKKTLHISEPTVYIAKDPGNNNIEFFNSLQEAGCAVCGLDTEGAVFTELESFAETKKQALSEFDLYITWGVAQAELLQKYTHTPEVIVPTGNPRFDLLNPELRGIYFDEAKQILNNYGEYVLFNTNFSWANHYNPSYHKRRHGNNYDLSKYRYISELYNEFLSAIHSLEPNQIDYNIIIRPHPSESRTRYEQDFRNYENVFVEDSGDVRSWIAGASVTVHNSCTTGIETAMMNKPVISYRPIKDDRFDKELPNFVSEEITNRSELANKIQYFIDNDVTYNMNTSQKQQLKRFFHNVDTIAAEQITDSINSLDINDKGSLSHIKPDLKERIKWQIKISRVSGIAVKVYDSFNRAFGDTESAEIRKYIQQKFPGLSEKEIRSIISRFDTEINTENIDIIPVSNTLNSFKMKRY